LSRRNSKYAKDVIPMKLTLRVKFENSGKSRPVENFESSGCVLTYPKI
jgi:hypothetical protein